MNPSDVRRHVGKYYGKYSGEVIDVADRSKLGRIKVTVPSVLADVQVWARPCFASGHFFVPPVGATGGQGHMVTLGSKGVVAVEKGGSRVEITDGKVKITGTTSVQIVAKELSLAAGSISLGGSAAMSAILGEAFMTAFATHVHPTALGPSGPPTPPIPPTAVLSRSVKVQP